MVNSGRTLLAKSRTRSSRCCGLVHISINAANNEDEGENKRMKMMKTGGGGGGGGKGEEGEEDDDYNEFNYH